MIAAIGNSVITPVGHGGAANVDAVLSGRSSLMPRPGMFGLPETFVGSVFDRNELNLRHAGLLASGLTLFEAMCVESVREAAVETDLSGRDTIFILSTTKGNVSLLEHDAAAPGAYLSHSAMRIARHFGNTVTPLVVSNACISGVAAQMAAARLLQSGMYSTAVVTGGDLLSRFIVSGFQSFKALSDERCRPFDVSRKGLNLGEAFGTLILRRQDFGGDNLWEYVASSNHNDANHISGPSRTGEGSYRVLRDLLAHADLSDLAFVNLHGTATNYNDEMESIAMDRAGIPDVPANGTKGIFGHTLGAAGIIETVLGMHALERGTVLPTPGFSSQGTSRRINVSDRPRAAHGNTFFKILSGFGGSNAGICYRKGGSL